MNKWLKMLIWLVVIGVVGGICYVLWGPKEDFNQGQNPLDTEFSAVHFVHEEDGRKIIEIFAEGGGLNLQDQSGDVRNLKIIFFREDGTEWQLTSPSGTVGNKANLITLDAPIRGEEKDGRTYLACDGSGTFKADEKTIELQGGVLAARDDIVLTGESLLSDLELNQVKIKGNQVKLRKGGTRP